MRKLALLSALCATMLMTTACTPLEKQAYRTIVSAKAFIDSEKSQHPECASQPTTSTCVMLRQATSSKDALIDAAEVYCASPSFDAGGPCTPAVKGTPAAQVATDKLKAAISGYNQIYKDMKGAL